MRYWLSRMVRLRGRIPVVQPVNAGDWVISGPHFFVGTPLAKSASTNATTNRSYDDIDLTGIGENYLPRAVYRPGNAKADRSAFERNAPRWPDNKTRITSSYRYVNRRRISISTERSLISAIAPVGSSHIHPVLSLTFRNLNDLVLFAGLTTSIVIDFLLRVTGKADLYESTLANFPLINEPFRGPVVIRGLRLNSVTRSYSELWTAVSDASFRNECWTSDDRRLCHEFEHPWGFLNPKKWDWMTPLRSDFARRQASGGNRRTRIARIRYHTRGIADHLPSAIPGNATI